MHICIEDISHKFFITRINIYILNKLNKYINFVYLTEHLITIIRCNEILHR